VVIARSENTARRVKSRFFFNMIFLRLSYD